MSAARSLHQDWRSLVGQEIEKGLIITDTPSQTPIPKGPSILVADSLTPEQVLRCYLEQGYSQIVQTSSSTFETQLVSSARTSLDPQVLLDYPLSSILAPDDVGAKSQGRLTLFSAQFSRAVEKSKIMRQVEGVLQTKVKSSSLLGEAITVTDELVTNAIFNAPFTDLENLHPGESRENLSVAMTEGHHGELFLGTDGERLVIGCRDPYGSLNAKELTERITNCYTQGVAATMNLSGRGGAGIGSFMIFNSSASYHLAVGIGKITMVCATLLLKGSGRTRAEAPKSLHILNL